MAYMDIEHHELRNGRRVVEVSKESNLLLYSPMTYALLTISFLWTYGTAEIIRSASS